MAVEHHSINVDTHSIQFSRIRIRSGEDDIDRRTSPNTGDLTLVHRPVEVSDGDVIANSERETRSQANVSSDGIHPVVQAIARLAARAEIENDAVRYAARRLLLHHRDENRLHHS